jgi:hypothetical protein
MYGVLGWKSKKSPNDVFVIEKPSSDDWMSRDPHRFLAPWAQWNDTMGDGWTAHTPNTYVTAERINDYLSGLLEVLLGEREHIGDKAEGLKVFVAHFPKDVNAERTNFLKTLTHKGDGTYYHTRENKTSKADKCKHDDRWVHVPQWAGTTGTNGPATIYGLEHYRGHTAWGLERAFNFTRYAFHAGTYDDFGKFYGHGGTDATQSLVAAAWELVSSVRARQTASRILESALHNLKIEEERAAKS